MKIMNIKKQSVFALVIGLLCINQATLGIKKENTIKENIGVIGYISNLLHASLDRGKGFKTPFKRGPGFWSTPKDEENTSYFSQLAEPETQREDWYAVTPYISEFWCAVSNLGLVYVGLKHESPEVVIAGLASFLYHSIPKQWLLHVDRLGVLLAFTKFAREYKVIIENPKLSVLPLAVVAINGADVYLGQYKGLTWPHAVWHLSAAWLAHLFLSKTKKTV